MNILSYWVYRPECPIVPLWYRTRQYRESKKTRKCENTGVNTVQLEHSSYSVIQWVNKSCTKKVQRFFFSQWNSWFWSGVGGKNEKIDFKIRLFWTKCICQERFERVFFVNRTYICIILKILLKLPKLTSNFWMFRPKIQDLSQGFKFTVTVMWQEFIYFFFEIVSTVTVTVQFYYM